MQAVDLGVRVIMIQPHNGLFCRLDGLSSIQREQQRLNAIKNLGLLETETIPVFEEATQTAARFLEVPICILGLVVDNQICFKSAVGLSQIGLMNQLAAFRRIPRLESYSTYVIDSQQPLAIEKAATNSVFATSALVQHYGIQSYMGTPLITSEGVCIGTLEVWDTKPHRFTPKEADFLSLTARWCLGEFERNQLLKSQQINSTKAKPIELNSYDSLNFSDLWHANLIDSTPNTDNLTTNAIKVKLLSQLTQELKTPLTSVIGMASILNREFYGPLTAKQKEYVEIIHDSGKQLISLVDEIANLGVLEEVNAQLQLTSVDIEMLCQQIINRLKESGSPQQHDLRLSVEPGNRIWTLDKEKIRQAIYYLVTSVLASAEAGGEVRIHVSRRHQQLNIAVWLSHPWLGEGLTAVDFYSPVANCVDFNSAEPSGFNWSDERDFCLTAASIATAIEQSALETNSSEKIKESLGLLLCCHIVELHGGQVLVQSTSESKYRYLVKLPLILADEQ